MFFILDDDNDTAQQFILVRWITLDDDKLHYIIFSLCNMDNSGKRPWQCITVYLCQMDNSGQWQWQCITVYVCQMDNPGQWQCITVYCMFVRWITLDDAKHGDIKVRGFWRPTRPAALLEGTYHRSLIKCRWPKFCRNSQLSSFFRFGPISSHNLLQQLLKL